MLSHPILIFLILILSAGNEAAKIVVAGGFDGDQMTNVDALDTQSGLWSSMPDLPTANCGSALTFFDNGIYEIAGRFTDSQVLVFTGGSWSPVTSLPHNKGKGASAFTIGDTVYVVGGDDDNYGLLQLKSGLPVWTAGPSSINPHVYSIGTVFNGSFYICGTSWLNPSNVCETYDPNNNVWTATTSMLEKRAGFSLVAQGNFIYAIGGIDGKNEKFDPVSKTWSYIQATRTPRRVAAVASDGQDIYAIGGQTSDGGPSVSSVELYIPKLDIWQSSADLPSPRREMGVVFVPDSFFGVAVSGVLNNGTTTK